MVIDGSTLYVGGQFTSIGGQTRNRAAALDIATGTPTAWDPNANGLVRTLTLDGANVYAGGFFTNIGGQLRNNIAKLNTTTGAAANWNPNANSEVFQMIVDGTTVYAAGTFTSIGGQTRNRIAALPNSGANPIPTAWDPNADAHVTELALDGSILYVGGTFSTIGGAARSRIAAIHTGSGIAVSWNPGANDAVQTLALSGSSLYAGGLFRVIGGDAHPYFAALPTASTADDAPLGSFESSLALTSSPNPVRARAAVRFAIPTAGSVHLAVFDVAGRRVATLVNHEWMSAGSAGSHDATFETRALAEGVYFARLEVGSQRQTTKILVVR
jgi:hypothetical protein